MKVYPTQAHTNGLETGNHLLLGTKLHLKLLPLLHFEIMPKISAR